MHGTVSHINHHLDLVAVRTVDGRYSVFKVLEPACLEVGDRLVWRNEIVMGEELVTNENLDLTVAVYFTNHWLSRWTVRKQLGFPDTRLYVKPN